MPEDPVVQVPRLLEVLVVAALLVALAVRERLLEVAPELLLKQLLLGRLGPPRHEVVHWLQHLQHALGVLVHEIAVRRLLERLVPEFVPENGDTDELAAEELGLRYQPLRAVFVGGLYR